MKTFILSIVMILTAFQLPFLDFFKKEEDLVYPTHEDAYVEPRDEAVESLDIPALESSRTREVNLVDDLHATPNDTVDDSPAFEEALRMAATEPIKLVIPTGEYYLDAKYVIEGRELKGLHIEGDDAVLKPLHPQIAPMNEHFVLALRMAEDNVGVKIEGVTVDGSRNPQDLYFTMQTPEDVYDTPLQRGFYIDGAKDIVVTDTAFKHMYGGYTLSIHDYENVDLQHIQIDDVGGDDITDSFGMAFYFGGHDTDAVINIDDVIANGKVSPRDPSYTAWIGVVLENGTIQDKNVDNWLVDQNTTVNVTNSTFLDYETTFHVESMAGNVYWNTDNVKTRAKDYFIAAGVNGELKERTYNLDMEMTPYGRNGIIHGLYYTEKERDDNITGFNRFDMYQSTIKYLTDGDKYVPIGSSYGDSVAATYHNVLFNQLPSKLVTNATGIFKDSVIIIKQDSLETPDSLLQGPFSEPSNQTVKMENTTVIREPETAMPPPLAEKPKWYVPSGYQAPEMAEPIAPAELHSANE
ncbi:hypothetical protein HZY86_01770 [Aerococcaceae bacterium DSM 111020]|nr:hypothetical protein [Aerococcaceae bacterium DSM 111020]